MSAGGSLADPAAAKQLLRAGETCWRVAPASRVAFLIDGEAYFGALADALENAQRSVWLLGWDIHSDVLLRRGAGADRSHRLVPLLEAVVARRPALRVRVLAWDFAMLYALERQLLPGLHFGARTHPRIRFAMDGSHPLAACHHQKLVVIDDAMAFAGGFDLTSHRWDTRAHRANDPRRVTPSGRPYAPFHDVQIAVDGDAAAALAQLARQRWQRATGETPDASGDPADPWPPALSPDVRDVEIGISRTLPQIGEAAEIREVETLYRESIASAQRSIYIENQYLTSARIAGWLAERLALAQGPEVVIVGPRHNAHWLEDSTMGALRDRHVRSLRAADRRNRLRVLYPHLDTLPADQMLNVHSKVMVVDDDFVRVGSSNLSNRSLGLDTECDLSIEARGSERVRRAIARFRDGLLAEHLGVRVERFAEGLARNGSLVETVDALCGGPRTLRPLELDASGWAAETVDALGVIDPEHPVPLEELAARFEGDERPARRPRGRSLLAFAGTLVALVVLGLGLESTPIGDWTSTDRLGAALAVFRETWYGPLLGAALFVLACLLLVPVTTLTLAAGLAFEPFAGVGVAWLGTTVAAALGYLVGEHMWSESVRRMAGSRLETLSRRLARRGILSSAVVRVLPVAPFMVVNLVAGASHVRARDFIAGTALGILPGTLLLVLAADWARALLAGSAAVWLWVALGALALAGAVAALRRLPWRQVARRRRTAGEAPR